MYIGTSTIRPMDPICVILVVYLTTSFSPTMYNGNRHLRGRNLWSPVTSDTEKGRSFPGESPSISLVCKWRNPQL